MCIDDAARISYNVSNEDDDLMHPKTLTQEQLATNADTYQHIERVRDLLQGVVIDLLQRSASHDQSKLSPPEVEAFTEHTSKLAALTYGSPEYDECRKLLGPALKHHYANNSHHPEHYKNGINDMNILDVIEMLCDWKAASERHNYGNIRYSIEKNAERFGISPQLQRIMENTVSLLEQ